MATYKANKGSGSFMRSVIVRDAFVASDAVEAELEQPKGTFITNIYVRFLDEVPELPATSTADLGFKAGITTGGVELVAADTDGFIANNASNSSIVANSIMGLALESGVVPNTTAGAASRTAAVGYASEDRTLFLNTTAAGGVDTSGDVEWIVEFKSIGTPH